MMMTTTRPYSYKEEMWLTPHITMIPSSSSSSLHVNHHHQQEQQQQCYNEVDTEVQVTIRSEAKLRYNNNHNQNHKNNNNNNDNNHEEEEWKAATTTTTTINNNITPFPQFISDILLHYNIEQFLIQFSDLSRSSIDVPSSFPPSLSFLKNETTTTTLMSSTSSTSTSLPNERIGIPIGISVYARFHYLPSYHVNHNHDDYTTNSNKEYQTINKKWSSLLRLLSSGSSSFLGCGANNIPLDSIKDVKHEHSSYHNPIDLSLFDNDDHDNNNKKKKNGVYSIQDNFKQLILQNNKYRKRRQRQQQGDIEESNSSRNQTSTLTSALRSKSSSLEYFAVLPTSEGGVGTMMCIDGMKAFQSLLPCGNSGGTGHKNKNPLGLFGQLSHDKLLYHSNKNRKSLWIDASVDVFDEEDDGDDMDVDDVDGCFHYPYHNNDEQGQGKSSKCALSLRQGITYTVPLPPSSSSKSNTCLASNQDDISISLNDVLGGSNGTISNDHDAKSYLHSCPLSDSTLIYTKTPKVSTSITTSKLITTESAGEKSLTFQHEPMEKMKEEEEEEEEEDYDKKYGEEETEKKKKDVVVAFVHDIDKLKKQKQQEQQHFIDTLESWMYIKPSSLLLHSVPKSKKSKSKNNSGNEEEERKEQKWIINRRIIKISPKQSLIDGSTGQLQTITRNGDLNCPVQIYTKDLFPRFIQPYFQTVQIWLYQGPGAGGEFFQPYMNANNKIANYVNATQIPIRELPIHRLTYHDETTIYDDKESSKFLLGSGTTSKSYMMELSIILPPDSSLWFSIEYDSKILNFEELPCDPNRGFDIPPSLATFTRLSSLQAASSSTLLSLSEEISPQCFINEHYLKTTTATTSSSYTLHSNALIIQIPMVDTTMPFNVISLTCTVYAFVIGTTINLLVRRASAHINKALGKEVEQTNFMKLKEKLKKVKSKIIDKFGRDSKSTKDVNEEKKNAWEKNDENEK